MDHSPQDLLNISVGFHGDRSSDPSSSPLVNSSMTSTLEIIRPTSTPLTESLEIHDSPDHLSASTVNSSTSNAAMESEEVLERYAPCMRPTSPVLQPRRWHPSDDVNKLLLRERPAARMVITSDIELNSVLVPTDTRYPSAEVLLARLKSMYDICVNSSGVMHLELREPESDVVGGHQRKQA